MHSGHASRVDNCTPEPPLLRCIPAGRRSASTSSSPEGGRRRHARGIHVPAECVAKTRFVLRNAGFRRRWATELWHQRGQRGKKNVKSASSKTWR